MRKILRALRLEFCLASMLPFLCGSLFASGPFDGVLCVLGAVTVLCVHLSANLINDYADSRSGVDWSDLCYYGFFGGSKLIQAGTLSETWYKNAAIFFAFLSAAFVVLICFILNDLSVFLFALSACALGWMYSVKPFSLSHRALGEPTIFILFGLVPFGAGYYLQTRHLFFEEIFLASLPYAFLVSAVLFANEVPDYITDRKAGKYTWVSLSGPKRAFLVYGLLQLGALIALCVAIMRGLYAPWVFVSIVAVIPVIQAIKILRSFPGDKKKLMAVSRITIAEHTCIGVILIFGGMRI
jgi:1,4-dihydroxy-2-naphthoate polyprenyltransferase